MKWRRWYCAILSFLRIHSNDCEHCNLLPECWGNDVKKRLQDLR